MTHPFPSSFDYSISDRIGKSPLAGRHTELERIRACLDRTKQGEATVLFVTGEPGIGKSRLLVETRRIANADGWQTLSGRSYEDSGLPPYLPWIELLGGFLETGQSELETRIANQYPELTQFIPGFVGDAGRLESPQGLSSEAERLRLFHALTRFLRRTAAENPLLLLIDDIQWADVSSINLLRYVALRLYESPILVVLAGRADEVALNDPLNRAIDEIHRQQRLVELPLPRLTTLETDEMVAYLLGRSDDDVARFVFRQSEGNPLFAEEIVKVLGAGGGSQGWSPSVSLPRGIAAVIRRSLDGLSGTCRRMLDCAALIGRKFDVDILAESLQSPDLELGRLIDEAQRRGVIRPLHDSRQLEFAHDRIRESITGNLNPLTKRALNTAIGGAIERSQGKLDAARAAALAYHFAEAQDIPKAVHYGLAAADEAWRVHAHAEAVKGYRSVLSLFDDADERLLTVSRPSVLLRLADAEIASNLVSEAILTYRGAANAADETGNRELAGIAYRRLGDAYARQEDAEAALRSYRRALQTIPGDNHFEVAQTLVQMGSVYGLTMARYAEGARVGRQALESSSSLGDLGLSGKARLALANTLCRSGDLAGALPLLEQALDDAIFVENYNLASQVCSSLSNYWYWTGNLRKSTECNEKREAFALAGGDPYDLRHSLSWRAIIALAQGDWNRALQSLSEAEPILAQLETAEPRAFQHLIEGYVHLQLGQCSLALSRLTEAIETFRQIGPGTLTWYLGVLCRAQIASGKTDDARQAAAEVEELVTQLPAGSLPAGAALGQLGLASIALGDLAMSARCYQLLLAHRGQFHFVLIDRVLGTLARILGNQNAAYEHLRHAEILALRSAMRPEIAEISIELALTIGLKEERDHDQVQKLMAQSANEFASLGMPSVKRHQQDLAAPVKPATELAPANLTSREIEVLGLVVAGHSNRKIANLLTLSEKTVANHLTHIFTKIGVDNRASAVAYALRRSLA